MVKTKKKIKIKVAEQKFKEIKKQGIQEIKKEAEEKESEEQERKFEEGQEEKTEAEEFEFFPETGSERKSPLLETAKPREKEELETRLEGVETKKDGEKKEEKIKYDIPSLYSESSSEGWGERERDVTELMTDLRKKNILTEAPRILPRESEEGMETIKPAELTNVDFREYIIKYAERHKEDEAMPDVLRREDKDIKKYKGTAKFKDKVY